MLDRYFVDALIQDETVLLAGPEAHHLAHVMRAKPGLQVTLFDGSDREYLALVERVGRAEVSLRVLATQHVDRELTPSLILGVALPKGDRQRWLVEKAVELGVSTLVPLSTTRGVAQPTDNSLLRLQRAVIEASKQCGRNRLMRINEPKTCRDYLAQANADAMRILAHPAGIKLSADVLPGQPPVEVFLAIGPEGGFTDEEVELASAKGWIITSLGPRILRVETAATYLVACVASAISMRYPKSA